MTLFKKTIKKATFDNRTNVLTVNYSGGETEEFYKFENSWHRMPMMKRALGLEDELQDIFVYIHRHGNPYPTKHEIQNNP